MTEEPTETPPRLNDEPLDRSGIGDVIVLRAITPEAEVHGCDVRVWAPIARDGRTPPTQPPVLAIEPEFEMLRSTRRGDPVAFGLSENEFRCQVAFPEGTSFFGTGEVAGPLLRNGRTTEFWNTDTWAYDEERPGLYQSHPFVLAIEPDGSAVGILAKSFRRGTVSLRSDGIEFRFEAEPYDVYRISGPTPQAVQRALGELVGRIELPPIWTLGYHQCRWSYMSADEVRSIASEFRSRDIPCEAIWFDIDYMDRCRVFTWDNEQFPDPKGLVEELHAMDFHVVAILDPGIAVAPIGYEPYESGLDEGHFVLAPSLEPARGKVWPGMCHFPDFSRDATRQWWGERVGEFLTASGVDGLWNDMNEPSVFGVPTQTLRFDAHHEGFGGGTHARFHNLYGQWMAEATHSGMRALRPERRPFVLTRSGHLGAARVAATWTGDNRARWEDLRWSISMALNLGLCGQPFVGPDIGGFVGDPDEELFVRWFELGAYLPFCRGHAEKTSCRKEPWAFGSEAEGHVRSALQRREALRPYLYSTFEVAAREGLSVIRPLFFADPANPELRAIDDAFLLGADLLVAPVVEAGAKKRQVLLPRGDWYTLYADEPIAPAGWRDVAAERGTTPVFARAGSVIPMRVDAESVELRVFLDRNGEASGEFYEDAGDGYADRRGEFLRTAVRARTEGGAIALESSRTGAFSGSRIARVRVVDAEGNVREREDLDPSQWPLRLG